LVERVIPNHTGEMREGRGRFSPTAEGTRRLKPIVKNRRAREKDHARLTSWRIGARGKLFGV